MDGTEWLRGPLADLRIRRQPDDQTCGPTCLHAVYRFFGDEVDFKSVLSETEQVGGGGTLSVLLASHALARGYSATLRTWNLNVFDPTWFPAEREVLRERLRSRREATSKARQEHALGAYIRFLDAGGELLYQDLHPALLRDILRRGLPILTGLSATFLYRESRELPDGTPDDVSGSPVGHFVLLTGISPEGDHVLVTDPLHPNPLSERHTYPVEIERVIGAIYLGVLTYDANLLVIQPSGRS